MFERSLARCSGSAMVPRKVIEDLEGAGALGRLSPNNRSPLQRTARVRDFAGRGYCYLAVESSIRDIA